MKKSILLSALAIAVTLAGCTSHYQLTGVSGTRIIVDKTYDVNPDAAALAFLTPYRQKVDSLMGPVVGEIAHDMAANRPESDLSNLLPDIFVYMAKEYNETPDFAVYNMGGIRAAFSKGKVTYGDVLDVAPFENKICFVSLKGDKVMELFEQIAQRGGEGVSKGVQLVITKEGKLVSAHLHGKTIDPEANYRIATIDYLAQGNDGLTVFKNATDINSLKDAKNNARYIIRDYFLEMSKQGKVIDSKVEGRIVIE